VLLPLIHPWGFKGSRGETALSDLATQPDSLPMDMCSSS